MAEDLVINKVIYPGVEVIAATNEKGGTTVYADVSKDTVTSETLVAGTIAHDSDGKPLIGVNPYELNATDQTVEDQAELIAKIKNALKGKAVSGDGSQAEYTRVDYIKFTGEQIVDTGIICNHDTKLRVLFTREKSTQHYLYGVASSNNTASVTAYLGGSWRFGNKTATKTITTNEEMIYDAVVDNSKISITGSVSTISSVNEFEAIGSLLLGSCRNSDGTIGAAQFAGKVLLCEIWQGEEEVLKLVPAVRKDGVYGFVDEVSGEFFESITDTPLDGGEL